MRHRQLNKDTPIMNDKVNTEGTEDNVIKGNFEGNAKEKEFAGVVINVNRYLSFSLDRDKDQFATSTHINGLLAITRPAHHDEMSMFSAAAHIQLELHNMIVRYEPWRQWDNALFTPRM